MNFLRYRETGRAQRHVDRLTPVPFDQVSGVMSLYAPEPAYAVSLVQQIQCWTHWGRGDVVALDGLTQPVAATWSVGSLMPFGVAGHPEHGLRAADAGEIRALTKHCRSHLSRHGSACGPVRDVVATWGAFSEQGVRSRQECQKQPVLAVPRPATGPSVGHRSRHPSLSWVGQVVHRAQSDKTEMVLPASVGMFTGELGHGPTTDGPGHRRHIDWLIKQGRSYVVLDDGAGGSAQPGTSQAMAFKADAGTLWHSPTDGTVQPTGAWARPDLRGRGVGAAALAGIVDAARRDHVDADGIASLYVDDYNAPVLALYHSLGFGQMDLSAIVFP